MGKRNILQIFIISAVVVIVYLHDRSENDILFLKPTLAWTVGTVQLSAVLAPKTQVMESEIIYHCA